MRARQWVDPQVRVAHGASPYVGTPTSSSALPRVEHAPGSGRCTTVRSVRGVLGDQHRVADQKERGTGFRLALVSIHLEGVKRDTIRDIVDPFRDMGFSEGIWP